MATRPYRPEHQRRYRRHKRSPYTLGDLDATSDEALRAAIMAFCCPWCDEGPFENMGAHWYLAHGVTARSVKLRLRLPVRSPINPPSFSEKVRLDNELHPRLDSATRSEIGRYGAQVKAQTPPTPLEEALMDARRSRDVSAWPR